MAMDERFPKMVKITFLADNILNLITALHCLGKKKSVKVKEEEHVTKNCLAIVSMQRNQLL